MSKLKNWVDFKNEFVEGQEILITEFIKGEKAIFIDYGFGTCRVDGKAANILIEDYPKWIKAFCSLNQNVYLHGVLTKGRFFAFDVSENIMSGFLDYDNAFSGAMTDLVVPVLYRGPYSNEVVFQYAGLGPSGYSDIVARDGIVIRPSIETFSEVIRDRLMLKIENIKVDNSLTAVLY